MPDTPPPPPHPHHAAVFFDRDNTLILGHEYLGDAEQVTLVPGAAEAVAAVRTLGYDVVTASNQSGVARGHFTEDDVRRVNDRMDDLLLADNPEAVIDRHLFCPHHPEAENAYGVECDCRKPKAGMFRAAAAAMGLDLSKCWLVGDAPRDVEAGHAAGCRTILLTLEGVTPSPAASDAANVEPDFRATTLAEATAIIARNTSPAQAAPPPATEASIIEDHEPDEPDEPEEPDIPSPDASLPPDAAAEAADSAADDRTVEPPSAPEMPPTRPKPTSPPPLTPERATAAMLSPPAAPPPAPPPAPKPPHPQSEASDPRSQQMSAATEKILAELRREREAPREEFNVFRLLGGAVQVLAIGALIWGLLFGEDGANLAALLTAIFLQLMALTLVMAGGNARA